MTDRARHALSFAVLLAFTFMLAGTSKSKSSSSGSPTPPPTPNPTTGTAPTAPATPLDVNVALVQVIGGCTRTSPPAGCRVLKDFETADAYNDPPAGKIVWYGESFGLGSGSDTVKEPFFVQVESSPTGPGASARSLIPENAKEKKDANDLLAATKLGKTLPGSQAASYMRTAQPPGGLKQLMRTTGRSHAENEMPHTVFFRRLGNRLLVLEYNNGSPLGHSGATSAVASAWIAELWPLR